MDALTAKQVLSNLYGLMMEINYHRAEEDTAKELEENADTHVEKHLIKIRQLSAKLRAKANDDKFKKAIEQINALKQRGLDELRKLIQPKEQSELLPLFRKFEELSENDQTAILEDQELLYLIEVLNNRSDGDQE